MPTPQRTKLLFVITKSNWGGAQRYVYDLATNLPPEYDVSVALGGDGPLKDKLAAAGVRVIPIPGLQRDISLKQELRATRALAHIIRTERPDILHINSSKAGAIGTVLGRLLRVPTIIFTAHGWAFNEDRSWVSRQCITFVHWLTVISSHTTIAVSVGMQRQLTWPGAQQKMTVIHPGRDVAHMLPKAEARLQLTRTHPALSSYEQDVWLGTIAELHPIKRLATAIAAMAELVPLHPQLRYIIIGEGSERASLETLIARHRLEHHVFLVGHITEAAHLLPAFDTFVLPSKSESFGYVLVEAGAAQLPVVATATGGITDIITHNKNGLLVPKDNATLLADAVNQLIRDNGLHRRLSNAHQQTAMTFNIDAMVTRTCEVYQDA